MEKPEINNLIQNPAELSIENISSLEKLSNEYPYFQAGKMLYLKALHNTNDLKFDTFLNKTAVQVPNRERLHFLIIKEELTKRFVEIDKEISRKEQVESEVPTAFQPKKAPENENEAIIPEKVVELENQIIQEAIAASISLDVEEVLEPSETKTAEEKPPVEIDISQLSFTQWLKYSSGNALKASPKKSIELLVDEFISTNPKIQMERAEFFSASELARKSLDDNLDLVTETLANIYIHQGNFSKAIKAFERLSLNYPEKSTYFADRIKSVEELITKK